MRNCSSFFVSSTTVCPMANVHRFVCHLVVNACFFFEFSNQINSIYFLFEFCWNYFNVKRYANDKFSSDWCFDVSCEIMSKNSQYSEKCSWAYSELINQWTTVWEKQTAQTSAHSKHNLIFWSILCTNPLNEHTL